MSSERHPDVLIARPNKQNLYRGLSNIPFLGKEEADELRLHLPIYIMQHLDTNTTWLKNDDISKEKYLAAVKDKFPCLVSYEQAWPAEWFAIDWLHRRRMRGPQKMLREFAATRSSPDSTPSSASSTQKTASSITSSIPSGIRSAPKPAETADLDLRSASPPATYSAKPTVRGLVASIRPPMPEIAPILIQGGVRDKACLAVLIAMTEVQQRAVLERLPLNVFQVQVLCNALAQFKGDR